MKEALPFGQAYYHHFKSDSRNIDLEDEPVWNLMATLAVSASMDQQHSLVQELREKILENVVAAKRERENLNLDPNGFNDPTLLNDERNDLRIRNVNLLVSPRIQKRKGNPLSNRMTPLLSLFFDVLTFLCVTFHSPTAPRSEPRCISNHCLNAYLLSLVSFHDLFCKRHEQMYPSCLPVLTSHQV